MFVPQTEDCTKQQQNNCLCFKE